MRLFFRVPYPVSIVITDRQVGAYNRVFFFLMQVKRAKWTLDTINIRGASGAAAHLGQGVNHKKLLLRSKLRSRMLMLL